MEKTIEIKVEFINGDEPIIIKEKFDNKEIEDIKDAKEIASRILKNGIINEEILTGYIALKRIVVFYPSHMIKKITIIEPEISSKEEEKIKKNRYK